MYDNANKTIKMILMSFELELCAVRIIKTEEIANGALFVITELIYPENIMRVPVVYYPGENWIFTPSDWQGKLPETQTEMDSITWRVNNTDVEAINFDGVPMTPMTATQYVFSALQNRWH